MRRGSRIDDTENRPPSEQEMQWLCWLRGELDDARKSALEAELDADSALRARFEAWRTTWNAVELPVRSLDTSLAPVLVARLRAESQEPGTRGHGSPAWARAAAVAALVSGLALGLGIESMMPSKPTAAALRAAATEGSKPGVSMAAELEPSSDELRWPTDGLLGAEDSLAEAYWLALEADGETLFGGQAEGEGS